MNSEKAYLKFFNAAQSMMTEAIESQDRQILAAAKLIAKAIKNGGIIQAFGSGHSYGTAIEICGRAGGYIPTKAINTQGVPETIEGNGTEIMKTVEVLKEDVFVVISNSGRNPLAIEIAMAAKKKGAQLIVVTSLQASKKLKSKHSSGKLLYQLGDVVLDNHAPIGDAGVSLSGLESKVGGMSAISGALLLQSVILQSVLILVSQGITPPVYMSMNVDGGPLFNEMYLKKYAKRIDHR